MPNEMNPQEIAEILAAKDLIKVAQKHGRTVGAATRRKFILRRKQSDKPR